MCPLQWGSVVQTSLDFEWSERGWVANSPDFKWALGPANPILEHRLHSAWYLKGFSRITVKRTIKIC